MNLDSSSECVALCLVFEYVLEEITMCEKLSPVRTESDIGLVELLQDLSNEIRIRRSFAVKETALEKSAGTLDKIEENYMHRMRWIWDVDLKAQLEQAQKIMKQ